MNDNVTRALLTEKANVLRDMVYETDPIRQHYKRMTLALFDLKIDSARSTLEKRQSVRVIPCVAI